MTTEETKKQLSAAYNKATNGLLSYFENESLPNNLHSLMVLLQYVRDITFIESEDPDNDLKLKTLQAAMIFFNNWLKANRKLAAAADLTTEARAELIKVKDANYRNFWEIVTHSLESWFE